MSASVAAPPAGARTATRPAGRDVRAVARGALGLAGMIGIVAGTLTIAAAASAGRSGLVPAARLGFPPWMRGPLSVLGGGTMTPTRFTTVVLIMFACYAAALAGAPRLPSWTGLATITVATVVMGLCAPIVSADVFGYLDFARMGVLHGLSPYTHDSGSALSDAVVPFLRWHHLSTPYGPVFTLVSYPLAWLGVPAGLWMLKAIAVLAALACVALTGQCARRRGIPPHTAMRYVGLNPLLLVFAVGGAHNDLLLTAVVLTGVLWTLRGREAGGAAGLVVAVGMKASAVVVLPFMLLGARRRRSALAGALAGAAAVAAIGLVAFGPAGLGFVQTIGSQQDLVAAHAVPAEIAGVLGLADVPGWLRGLCAGLAAAASAGLLWWTWRGADWLRCAAWATFAVLLGTAWLLPWYVVWLIPLAALGGDRRLAWAAAIFSLLVVASHLPLLTP